MRKKKENDISPEDMLRFGLKLAVVLRLYCNKCEQNCFTY